VGTFRGAHYNPAVTLAILIRKKINIKEALNMVSQLVGALAAALLYYLIYGQSFVPAPNPDLNIFKPLVVEIGFTFALAMGS